MTVATCSRSDELRRRSCQSRQTVFKARAVCSIVNWGFFPPQPGGLLGHEEHHRLTEDHVPEQTEPASSLEVSEADLGLDQAEGVLDFPAAEGDFEQGHQGRLR